MRLLLPCAFLLLSACASPDDARPQRIVDQAIAAHGDQGFEGTRLQFEFRGMEFDVTHNGGRFEYARTYTDSTGRVREVLNNDGLYREVNGARVPLPDSLQGRVETAVNSVPYFVLLPWRLNDDAVRKQYVGTDTLGGEPYHRIGVTFRRQGGGRDYEDRFMYWFHQERHTMDYLAYYFEEGPDGTRFRQAYNPRTIAGRRFQDYRNFAADSADVGTPIQDLGRLFEAGRLREVSVIATERPRVEPLDAPEAP